MDAVTEHARRSADPGTPNPNLAARMIAVARRHPARDAIITGRSGCRRRLTFDALARDVAEVAAGLRARGVAPGDSVLLFVPMSVDLYVLLLAIHHLGACAVFVDAWAGRSRLDQAVRAARPRAFIGTPRAHLLRVLSPALRAIPRAIVVGGPWPLARIAVRGAEPDPEPVDRDAPALVTFTTGSTGTPKAAVRSHGFLWAQHVALQDHLQLRPEDIDLPTLPVFVLNNLAVGCTTVLPDFDPRRPADIDPARIMDQIEAERVTTTSGSPAFYERLATWCRAGRRTLPFRALFTGGAPVLPPLVRLLLETVAGDVHVVYGGTEAEPISGINARDLLAGTERGGEGLCVGNPVAGIRMRLVRPWDAPIALGADGWRDWDVAAGEVGEIVVSGDHVLPEYAGDPEANRAHKIRDGSTTWHRTGDAGRLDPEGRLWLMGRVKRRVLRLGETWWGLPAEVRALEVEGVRHAAYLGLPDAGMGQRAVLCVETDGGRLATEARERLVAAVAPHPVDELRALAEIPRDPRHRSKTDTDALVREIER
jgi:acyl-coenzyme A synthetase/AMP-(fatty) acid ligase